MEVQILHMKHLHHEKRLQSWLPQMVEFPFHDIYLIVYEVVILQSLSGWNQFENEILEAVKH